jgi:hypothetical protein
VVLLVLCNHHHQCHQCLFCRPPQKGDILVLLLLVLVLVLSWFWHWQYWHWHWHW